ncbi:hypothetical protein [Streptomyces sp. HUAS TT7]|uniref:hypothetical protein n=1 Tax=Streptomyces sp. HUAS TT7 TaxID=3447507 RepID=UPI003F65D301
MALSRRRDLVRTTAVAAVASSALLMPAAAAFADEPGMISGVGTLPAQDDKPGEEPEKPATDLKITNKTAAKGKITYTLSSGDTAVLLAGQGPYRAHITGGGAEGHLSDDGEQSLASPTGATFDLDMLKPGGDSRYEVRATLGGKSVTLAFPVDKQQEKPGNPGKPAERLRVTKKAVGMGEITYTLSSGDKARLFWGDRGRPGAHLTGTGAEGFLSADGEKALASPTGVNFELSVLSTLKASDNTELPRVFAKKGKDSLTLDFPDKPAMASKGAQQTKVTPRGGVRAGAELSGTDNSTVLLAGGGAAVAAAGLGFAALRRRPADD